MLPYRRCWVIGAGAVGSVIAGVLYNTQEMEIHLVGSSVHVQRIQRNGLFLEIVGQGSTRASIPCVKPEEVPPLRSGDLVLMTGKVPSLEKACARLRSTCNPETVIIVLQNGIGPEEIVSCGLGRSVERGLVFFGANCPSPGKVRYFPGIIRLRKSAATQSLCKVFEETAIRCELIEDFKKTEWLKLAINCIANPFAGILQANNRQITEKALDPAKEAILAEVRQVARAEGVPIRTTASDINRYFNQENIPSLRTDLERGKPTEIDVINGTVIRLGRQHGIPTPANDLLVSMVKYLEKAASCGPSHSLSS